MITNIKIKHLERRVMNLKSEKNRIITYRETIDGQLVNKDGYLLSAAEIAKQTKENEEITTNGGLVIKLVSYRPVKSNITVAK